MFNSSNPNNAGYKGMQRVDESLFMGGHHEIGGLAGVCIDNGLVRTDSMDVVNDPRLFSKNVLNFRLQAFHLLHIVAGLLMKNALGQLLRTDKRMILFEDGKISINGCLQLICFASICGIFFQTVLAIYVGIAQPYHTYRLMSAGPTGFDAATSYYLNRNITAWRHYAIKGLLSCLPLYILEMGLRLSVKFDRETELLDAKPEETPTISLIQGILVCGVMQALAITLLWVHHKHFSIFAERYELMTEHVRPLQGMMNSLMMPRASAAANGGSNTKTFGFLDV
jgi:hypothetical protein